MESTSSKRTRPILTKYEKTAILGTRMEQLQRDAEPYVTVKLPFDPKAVALEEIKQRKLPFKVCRVLPDGTKEIWKLEDMEWS